MQTITLDGETKTIAEWAKITGISTSGIRTRLMLGWPAEKILKLPQKFKTTPTSEGVSKTAAERKLDETPYDQLPDIIRDVIPVSYKKTRYGTYTRRYFPKAFDAWFCQSYCNGVPEVRGGLGDVPKAD